MKKLYRLYARWTDETDRASSVKYTVHHGDGTSDIFFNQQYNGSTWMSLGEFVMEPGLGHKIVLSHDSLDGLMAADAIRFEVIDDLPAVVADAIKLVSNDGEDLTYVHADHLGAPQKMTDKDRSVVWDVSFLPFGEEDSIIGSAANDNRFPGQRLSSETGLHYNYFRDYDPTTGRYLQSDPIGLAGGINTYGYVSGNPVNYVDPEGESAVGALLPLAGGAALSDGPLPFGDIFGGLILGGALAYDILYNENSESDEDAKQCSTPETHPEEFDKLKGNQGYRPKDKKKKNERWKKDRLHGDHWDISDKKGRKTKEVDFGGNQIWPNGPKNKNKK